jgi:hypothetical protein
VKYDTLILPKNTTIVLKDYSLKFEKDTVLILADTLFYRVSGNFYQRLHEKWGDRKWTKNLFKLLFRLPSEDLKLDTTNFVKSENPFLEYGNQRVGEITLTKLQPLGTSLERPNVKPKSIVQKAGNTVNFKTRDRVILNNLLFKKGDLVNPLLIADNERIIRELPYIKDARIYLKPRNDGSDIVDIEILTKDVLALSFDVDARDFDAGLLRINHKNIFGSGHEFDNRIGVDNSSNQKISYEVRYRVPNIKKSFTSFEIDYSNTLNRDFSRIILQRDFVTPKIKYAGGIEISNQRLRTQQLFNIESDQELDRQIINEWYDFQDFWLARSFPLGLKDPILNQRTRLIISARLNNIDYSLRPPVAIDLNQRFHDRTAALFSVGVSQRRYFKDQLIFGYGRTEDIPYGALIELTGGYEWGEFKDRYFLGGKLSRGGYIGNAGYFLGGLSLESYLYDQRFEQGAFGADFRFFSPLIDMNRWKFRQFINISYDYGIGRLDNEFVDIRDKNGIRGLKSNTLRGTQRFLMNIETVSFTPLEALNFRFAIFGFLDIGLVNNGERDIFREKSQKGIGLGVRIRNDNLTFRAIEIRFAYYPDAPIGIPLTDFDLSGNSGFRFSDFLINKPGAMEFR